MRRITKPQKRFAHHLLIRMLPVLDEEQRRIFLEALASGLGEAGSTFIDAAVREAEEALAARAKPVVEAPIPDGRRRRPGGGRKRVEVSTYPDLEDRILAVIQQSSGSGRDTPLYYTTYGSRAISDSLLDQGVDVSHTLVTRRLAWDGFTVHRRNATSLPYLPKSEERAQYQHIGETAALFLSCGDPVVSVDDHRIRESALPADFHFPNAFVELQADAPCISGAALCLWWDRIGKRNFSSKKVYVTVDRMDTKSFRLWAYFLQMLSDAEGITITVSHYPSGTSRWRKTAHRLCMYAGGGSDSSAGRDILAAVYLAGPCGAADLVGSCTAGGVYTDEGILENPDPPHTDVPPLCLADVPQAFVFEPEDRWNYIIHPGASAT